MPDQRSGIFGFWRKGGRLRYPLVFGAFPGPYLYSSPPPHGALRHKGASCGRSLCLSAPAVAVVGHLRDRVSLGVRAVSSDASSCVAMVNFYALNTYWHPAPREDPPWASVLLGAGRGSDRRKLPQPAPNHRSRGWPEQVPDRIVACPTGKAPRQQEFGASARGEGEQELGTRG